MLKKHHLEYYRNDCVFNVFGASHAWPEEEIENYEMPETKGQIVVF